MESDSLFRSVCTSVKLSIVDLFFMRNIEEEVKQILWENFVNTAKSVEADGRVPVRFEYLLKVDTLKEMVKDE